MGKKLPLTATATAIAFIMASDSFCELPELVPALSLGHTVLLVLPFEMSSSNLDSSVESGPSRVVQVTVEPTECVYKTFLSAKRLTINSLNLYWRHSKAKRTRMADTLAAFFLVQHEVSVSYPNLSCSFHCL